MKWLSAPEKNRPRFHAPGTNDVVEMGDAGPTLRYGS
jgi:hypothetical protein